MSEESKPVKKSGRWRRWLKRIVVIAVLLAVVMRLALPLVLPSIVRNLAGRKGLEVSWEKLDLSLLGGSLELWHLDARWKAPEGQEEGSGDAIAQLEYVTVDADVSALFTGDLKVHRVEADGIDLFLEREADGTWALSRLAGEPAPVEAEPREEERPPDAEPESGLIDFALPLEIAAVRLQHLRVSLSDASQPEQDPVVLDLSARVSDLGCEDRPARLQVLAHSAQVLDVLRVEGEVVAAGPTLDAELEVEVGGLRPGPLEGLLTEVGLRPVAEALSCSMTTQVGVEVESLEASSASASASIQNVVLRADLEEAVALDDLQIEVAQLSRTAIAGLVVQAKGMRGKAALTPEGILRVAGFELVPAGGEPQEEPESAPPPEPDRGESGAPFRLTLERAELADAHLVLRDQSVEPATDLEVAVEQLSAENLVIDPDRLEEVVQVSAQLGVPGVADSIALEGTARPFAAKKSIGLDLDLSEIGLARLAPYLEAVGLASDLEAGRLHARVEAQLEILEDGSLRADAAVSEVVLEDQRELFAIDGLRIEDLQHVPSASPAGDSGQARTKVGSIALSGTRLSIQRDSDGSLHVAGLRLPGVARDEQETDAERPGVDLLLEDVQLTLQDFAMGGESGAEARDQAQLAASFSAAGLARRFGLEGTIDSVPGPLDLGLDLAVRGEGLSLDALAPYLEELGIESQIAEAGFQLDLLAGVQKVEQGLNAHLSVTDLAFENAGETALALKALRVPELHLGEDQIQVGAISIEEPLLRAARDAEGGLLALGLRVVPEPAVESQDEVPLDDPPAKSGSEEDTKESVPAPTITLNGLRLAGATLHWNDAAVEPVVATVLNIGAELEAITIGAGAPSASFTCELSLDEVLETLALDADLRLDPADLQAGFDLSMEGLRAGPLVSYLPPGLRLALTDGRLRARVDCASSELEQGGRSASVVLQNLDYRDGEAGEPLLALERFALDVPRVDLEGGVVSVAELSSSGLAMAIRRTQATTYEALGLVLETAAPAASEESLADSSEASQTVEDAAAEQRPTLVRRAMGTRGEEEALPTVRLELLDLGLDRLHFQDETAPEASALVAGLRVSTPGPLTLLDAEPEKLPPIELEVSGRAEPIVAEGRLGLTLAPWIPDPELSLEFEANGLRGQGLTEVLPDLAEVLDGSELDGGRLSGALQAVMRIRRRNPTDFDLASGFGFELEVKDVELHDRPGGELLAGVESILVDGRSVRPETGDVHLRSIEINGSKGLARKEPEGFRALGLLLKTPAGEAQTEGQPEPQPEVSEEQEVEPEAVAQAPAGEEGPAPEAGPEIRIDQFLISGVEFDYKDVSVEPILHLPIEDLDLEVERLTTRALTESRPIHYRANIMAGLVELPERDSSSLLGGFLGAAAGVLTGGGDDYEVENRPAFEEIGVSGRLTLFPNLLGFTRLNLRSLELVNFRGVAAEAGVDLDDGLLDLQLDLRMRGDEGLTVGSKTNFSHLSVSEPADGPISSYLRLPAPLDTVLFVLRDANEEVVIPLNVRMGSEGLSTGAVVGTAVTTLGTLIAEAIAASPLRIVGGVLDMAGLDGQEPIELPDETFALEFEAGATEVDAASLESIEPLLELMRRDESIVLILAHELGAADLEQVERLANPPADERRDLANHLRQRRAELLRRRDGVAAELRARYAMGGEQEATPLLHDLRSLDRELSQCETAMDTIYETLRSGAERRAARRTRDAALELSRLRLEAARQSLLGEGVRRMPARIDLRRPRFGAVEGDAPGRILLTVRRRN